MSTPARKSGRQAKPTEKFKEYLYGSEEHEVSTKKDSKSPITGHTQISKEKSLKSDATSPSNIKKRGRPRKSIVDADSLNEKNNASESEDEDSDSETQVKKFKKDDINQKKELLKDLKQKKTSVNYQPAPSKLNSSDHPVKKRGRPRKVPIINTQPKCKTTMMTDTDTEDENEDEDADEDQITNKIASNAGGKGLDKSLGNTVAGSRISSSLPSENQESGPRRSGRPPKLNERLLNYLHLDEVSKAAHIVQFDSVSIEGQEFKILPSPNKLTKRDSHAFKVLPPADKLSVYDFIASPPKALKKVVDKENKKNLNIENEPRRSVRTPKNNSRLQNFLCSEVTPKRKNNSSQVQENSKNAHEVSIMGHLTPKKSDQKISEDITDEEISSPEPRRSCRVPKINERLLNYLNTKEGTIISLLFSEKPKKDQQNTVGLPELPSSSNSMDGSSEPSSGSKSKAKISREESEKTVSDLEPRRSSREPKTSEKLYNYLYSGEGKCRRLPLKSQISKSILSPQSSFQRGINAEVRTSPIGDLSPRRSSRAPKTNERLLRYLYPRDKDNKEKKKKTNTKSDNSSNKNLCSEEDRPNNDPRRSRRAPKTKEKLMNYLQPKDLEVASTSKGEPIYIKKQKRLNKESSDSGSSVKDIHIDRDSPTKININSKLKNKHGNTSDSDIKQGNVYSSKRKLEPSSMESLFKDEPLPIPHNAWLLCLGHHSSQFGYSEDTEKNAAKVYIENQGLYLGTHQILVNEYKRQLKEYFSIMPKHLRSKYLDLRANHIWNCFNEDIFSDIIDSSFDTKSNLPIVKIFNIDQIKSSINQLSSDSECENDKHKDKRKRKKRKGNILIRKGKKDIYENTSLIESDSSLKEDDNKSEASSNKDNDKLCGDQYLFRKSRRRKLSNVFAQQEVGKKFHHEIKARNKLMKIEATSESGEARSRQNILNKAIDKNKNTMQPKIRQCRNGYQSKMNKRINRSHNEKGDHESSKAGKNVKNKSKMVPARGIAYSKRKKGGIETPVRQFKKTNTVSALMYDVRVRVSKLKKVAITSAKARVTREI